MQKLERFRKDFVLRGEEREEENLNEAASHAKVRKSWKIGKDFVSNVGQNYWQYAERAKPYSDLLQALRGGNIFDISQFSKMKP